MWAAHHRGWAQSRPVVRCRGRAGGPLRIGGNGLARRGLLVRHLMMPGMLEETRAILRYVAEELGTGTYVNLMAQYRPAGLVTGASIFGIGGHRGARSLDITFDAHSSALVYTGRAVAANFDEVQAETG
jgi:hypothetical protein